MHCPAPFCPARDSILACIVLTMRVLPSTTQTADFTRTVWPQTTQKALLGQITSDEMMRTFDRLYFG